MAARTRVDRVHGWDAQEGRAMALSMRNQSKDTIALFETRYYRACREVRGGGAQHRAL